MNYQADRVRHSEIFTDESVGFVNPRGTKGLLYVLPFALTKISLSLTLALLQNIADHETILKEISVAFVVFWHLGIDMLRLGKYSFEKLLEMFDAKLEFLFNAANLDDS